MEHKDLLVKFKEELKNGTLEAVKSDSYTYFFFFSFKYNETWYSILLGDVTNIPGGMCFSVYKPVFWEGSSTAYSKTMHGYNNGIEDLMDNIIYQSFNEVANFNYWIENYQKRYLEELQKQQDVH